MIVQQRYGMAMLKSGRDEARVHILERFSPVAAVAVMRHLFAYVAFDGVEIDSARTPREVAPCKATIGLGKPPAHRARDIALQHLYYLRDGVLGLEADQEAQVIRRHGEIENVVLLSIADVSNDTAQEVRYALLSEDRLQATRLEA